MGHFMEHTTVSFGKGERGGLPRAFLAYTISLGRWASPCIKFIKTQRLVSFHQFMLFFSSFLSLSLLPSVSLPGTKKMVEG